MARRSHKQKLLYGRQPVCEMLRAGRRKAYRILLGHGVEPSCEVVQEIIRLAERAGLPIARVAQSHLDHLTGSANHQGVAAEVSDYPYMEFSAFLETIHESEQNAFVLLLDHIQDPQNLGSLLRTAEAAGVHGVIIPSNRAVMVTPAVARASAGAAEYVKVVAVANISHAMRTLKEEGLTIVGLEAEPEARLYVEADLTGPLGLIIGSEGKGLGHLVRETCDFLIRLPLYGRVTSLNAGVAAAIAIYEVCRQRRQISPEFFASSAKNSPEGPSSPCKCGVTRG